MAAWLYLVYALFPLPLISLVLLSIPLPNFCKSQIRGLILKVLDAVIFFKIHSAITVYHFAVLLSLFLFALTSHVVYKETIAIKDVQSGLGHRIYKAELYGLRWRAERNNWIAAFSLVLWLILYRVRALIKEVEDNKKKVE